MRLLCPSVHLTASIWLLVSELNTPKTVISRLHYHYANEQLILIPIDNTLWLHPGEKQLLYVATVPRTLLST